jgi:2'-5' RNA ligase
MPAHITVLFPFKPPHDLDGATLQRLRRLLTRFAPFSHSLLEARRFPAEVLYLAPVSDEPFRELTMAIWRQFPEMPPYGGRHPDVVPHLTVAQLDDARRLDHVAREFLGACQGHLPVLATVAEVALMDNASGRWRVRETLPLGRR